MPRRFVVDVPGVARSPSPISSAVAVGDTCYISGQLSVSDDGRYAPGTAYEEAARAFELVFRIAAEAGFSAEEIVYVDIAFADLADLPPVDRLYAELFPGGYPARTVYQAAALPLGCKVKVQAVAMRG